MKRRNVFKLLGVLGIAPLSVFSSQHKRIYIEKIRDMSSSTELLMNYFQIRVNEIYAEVGAQKTNFIRIDRKWLL